MDVPDSEFFDVTTRSLDSATDATVHEVRLTRPEKKNALPIATVGALATLFDSVDGSDGDAIAVTAAGDDFSLGADISDLAPEALSDPAALATHVQDLVAALRSCPLAVVAGVQGRAYGAGFLCCLGADLVVASEVATFAVPEVDLGIPVAGFTTTLLPQLVGERRAREWLFTGNEVDAKAAAEAGFVTEIATPDGLDETLDGLLADVAESSSTAIAALKAQLAPTDTPTGERARADEREAMRAAYEDGDAPERIRRLL